MRSIGLGGHLSLTTGTAVTTVVGLFPLVFNRGGGTELYRGLGTILLFGLLF